MSGTVAIDVHVGRQGAGNIANRSHRVETEVADGIIEHTSDERAQAKAGSS